MPWSNQSGGGGPWGSGGGGNNGNGGGRGPWGGGPTGGGTQPPDLEDWLRRSKDGLKNFQGGGFTPRNILIGIVLLLVIWSQTGWYRVQPDEVGLNMVFGKYTGVKNPPGLNYNWPYPIGSVLRPQVLTARSFNVGDSDTGNNAPDDSLILTGDGNIVDAGFTIRWQIDPAAPENYAFNLKNPEDTIRAVAESAMREAIGKNELQPILTGERSQIEQQVKDLMTKALDSYKAGVIITQVVLQKVDPPPLVIDAYRDQQAASADAKRSQNDAESYAKSIIPEAEGIAIQTVKAAEAYRAQKVAEATGQAQRFTQVYNAYKTAPDITRERLYLETMSSVLAGTDKVIIDSNGSAQSVVPYLPLDQMAPRARKAPNAAPAATAAPAEGTNP